MEESISQQGQKPRPATYVAFVCQSLMILTPVAYFWGYYYLLGYYNAYGLSDALISIRPDEAFIATLWSFLLFLLPALELLPKDLNPYLWFCLIVLVNIAVWVSLALVIHYVKVRLSSCDLSQNRLYNLLSDLDKSGKAQSFKDAGDLLSWFTRLIVVLCVGLLFILLLAQLAYFVDKQGAEWANKSQQEFKEQGCEQAFSDIWSSCVEIVDAEGVVVESGKLIHDTAQGIAIYTGEVTKIITLAPDQYLRFTQIPK